jgi:hypothetical protein
MISRSLSFSVLHVVFSGFLSYAQSEKSVSVVINLSVLYRISAVNYTVALGGYAIVDTVHTLLIYMKLH